MSIDEDDVRRGLHDAVALLAPPVQRIPVPANEPRRRIRALAVVAAAALIAALAVAVTLVHRDRSSAPANPVPKAGITCTGSGDVTPDVAPVRARLRTLGVSDAQVSASDSVLTIRSVTDPTVLRGACGSFAPAVRPVVLATVESPDRVHVAPPKQLPISEPQYRALPLSDRRHVFDFVRRCPTTSATLGSPQILCTPGSQRMALLLGPALLSAADIVGAVVQPPSPTSTQWTVTVSLSDSASQTIAAYTTAHHLPAGSDLVSGLVACQPAAVPCADFLAVVDNGAIVTVPVTQAPLTNGRFDVAGSFTEQSARAFALHFSPPLPVALTAG